MDIVLEAADKYVFDGIYKALFPVPEAVNSVLTESVLSSQLFESLSKNLSLSYIPTEPYEYTLFAPGAAAYMSTVARSNVYRQFISLFLITWFFGVVLYFFFASLSYFFIFDKRTMDHPKYLKNQIRLEMNQALTSMPVMSLLTAPWFLAEIHGYGKLYWDVNAYSKEYLFFQFPLFIAFTDFGIYLIHRGLHHPRLYKHLHKPHHKWIVPTPFASHAFHPVDGYMQSLPYHMFPFIFPLHKLSYLLLFSFINIWTILIHDGEYITQHPAINGAACHTIHHLYFNYNYGQFTTLWDRVGKSYRVPDPQLFDHDAKMSKSTWKKQSKEMETIVKVVETEDDRKYENDEKVEVENKKEK
ncbi:C-5 sterol desaturase [Myxozyma melibiosi]|uniref:C-5 sterol desaturase n=1 Tax=Myxozyma melibiosi TaxID=54550 RepID=A0ABR1F2I2_9ASCO